MLCTKRLKKDWSSMDASPNLNSARPRGISKPANQNVYYISGSISHWFVLFPGKISCSICCQSHHIWKTKAPNNSKTAGSRYFSARVVNTSGVLSAKIPGYREIPSAILFLRTIGVLLGVTIGMFLGFCGLFDRHWQFRCFEVSSYHQSFLLFY